MAATPEIGGQESESQGNDLLDLAKELDAPDDVQPEGETQEIDETPVEEKGVEDKDAETPAGTAEEEKVDPAAEAAESQRQLIATIRQMRKAQSISDEKFQRLEAQLEKQRERLRELGQKTEEDDDLFGLEDKQPLDEKEDDDVPLGEIEQLQHDIHAIAARRGDALSTIIETMAVNPKYEDVKEVCSRENLNDIIEAIAAKVSKEHGVDSTFAALKVEKEIWSQPNPYLWMYNTIKTYHPNYVKPAAPATEQKQEEEKPPVQQKGRKQEPKEAPGSIGDLGGSGDANKNSGWTAARLDLMDEEEYSKVPKNIREMYLAGDLA